MDIVSNLPGGLSFVSDSQDVRSIKENLGEIAEEYDSFFVGIADGDYAEVWGMHGIVPYNGRSVYRIVPLF